MARAVGRMFHLTARAARGRLLFVSWPEGLALFDRLTTAFPEALALCIMPDHLHLVLPHADTAGRLTRVKSGHARWLSARRDDGAHVWDTTSVEELPDEQHQRRTIRYVALNPCRAGLATDPLAWPLSLHRDHCGFGPGRPVAQPERHHGWVSADPTVRADGSMLPRVSFQDFDIIAVRDAVSAVLRVPAAALSCHGPARGYAIRTAWIHEIRSPALLGRGFGCQPGHVTRLVRGLPRRGRELADPTLSACVRAVGDDRFAGIFEGDLRRLAGWGRYRSRR